MSNQAACSNRHQLATLMGPSASVAHLVDKVERVARLDFSVIICGETGSGKELIANAVHQASPRRHGPFVAIDCGAIPEPLLESELFGHEKGAFTGACSKKNGKFEDATNGTLLLDEISNMTLGSQAKLLRALQEKRIYRVGGTTSFEVDVRILVSCNQDIGDPDDTDLFRRDLYYRLNEFTINVPPLRARKDDIPYLAKRFLDATNAELGKRIHAIADPAMTALLAFDWPGNVRQLRAVIRRAALLADATIEREHLELDQPKMAVKTPTAPVETPPWQGKSLKEIVKQQTVAIEKQVIHQVLSHTQGNKAEAARLLQVDYKTLLTKIKRSGIEYQVVFD